MAATLEALVTASHRSPKNIARNGARHPVETLRFFGLKPDMTVLEPGTADLAMTFRNVHNWIMADQEHAYFTAFYQALKPGGVLGIVEHRARPAADMDSMHSTGYVTEAYVKEIAGRAGFQFEAASEINANPNGDGSSERRVVIAAVSAIRR